MTPAHISAPNGEPGPEDLARISEGLRSLVVPIDSLVEDPENARKHTEINMKAIQTSLARFKQQKPIVFTKIDRIIRAGNGTWAAAKALGWKWIAANGSSLTLEEARAYGLIDNKASDSAEWNFANVSANMRALVDAGFDLAFTGFQAFEIAPLMQASFTPAAAVGDLEDTSDGAKSGAKTLKVPPELLPLVRRVFDAIKQQRRSVEPKMTDVRALEVLCLLHQQAVPGTIDVVSLPAPPSEPMRIAPSPVPFTLECPQCSVSLKILPGYEGPVVCPTCPDGYTPFQVAAARKRSPKVSA
jgi:ParB-like chromosome segregation protein Spo0J